MKETEGYFSWGRLKKTTHTIFEPTLSSDFNRILDQSRPWLPYGRGLSYGDVCTNNRNILVSTRNLCEFIEFDATTGLLKCGAGVRFDQIIDAFLPLGFFIPVTLGTKRVTVGGAIANDVHGKNHHISGTFGCHVREIGLQRSDGVFVCSPNKNVDLFRATIGGMGLTGLILWAQIQLQPGCSPWIRAEWIPFHNVNEYLDLSQQSKMYEHTAGWIDLLNLSNGMGRGILFRGAFEASPRHLKRKMSLPIPFEMPNSLVQPWNMKLFNDFYFWSNSKRKLAKLVDYNSFFFPLDALLNWNRMYGRRGFFQYQCVIPLPSSQNVLGKLIAILRDNHASSFLGVIKTFGSIVSPGVLSFPKEGVTLSVDLPNEGHQTLNLMNRLDNLVADSGGAVYPAKDARMQKQHFEIFFPQFSEFSRWIDPHVSSDFLKRVTS
ncbi:MAG: FAD-binding oxidoreductase [Bdellovibrionales bacterium]|nr:FAD-binding oxidoreductase [Bdellovibrionales bacterium]